MTSRAMRLQSSACHQLLWFISPLAPWSRRVVRTFSYLVLVVKTVAVKGVSTTGNTSETGVLIGLKNISAMLYVLHDGEKRNNAGSQERESIYLIAFVSNNLVIIWHCSSEPLASTDSLFFLIFIFKGKCMDNVLSSALAKVNQSKQD